MRSYLRTRRETQGDGARVVGAALLELAFGLRLLYGGWRSDKKPAAQLRLRVAPVFPLTQPLRSDHIRLDQITCEIRPENDRNVPEWKSSSSSFFSSV